MTRRLATVAAVALLAVFAAGPTRADRLHLDSGGHVDVARWWVEGDWIMYDGPAGTVGIPRGMVVRIERRRVDGATGLDARDDDDDRLPRHGEPLDAADAARVERWLDAAAAAFEERDFDRSAAAFLDVIRAAPELHSARVGYALSEIARDRDGHALSAILDGLAIDDRQPAFHEILGDLRDREERVGDALDAWRRSFELEPSDRVREKILKAERERRAGDGFDFGTTQHFTVRYDADVDVDLAAEVMDELESRYTELTDRFNHSPGQPITVQLYPTRSFREVTQAPEWVGGLYDGKIRVPLGGLSRLDPRARRVLAHELTHAIVHSKTRRNCPRWLHEGLAQIVEGRTLGDADLREIRERLGSGDPLDGAISYPVALGLTQHLQARQGFRGLVYLLDVLAEGATIDEALRSVYGQTQGEVVASWARELGRRTGS